jgi:hypothetical protein
LLVRVPLANRAGSFNHLVCAQQERLADVQAEHEIEDQIELSRLLDWNIRRLLAFQDFVDEIGRAPIGAGALTL